MPATKVSSLPAVTVPLAGAEILPVVQAGVSKQVTLSQINGSVVIPEKPPTDAPGTYPTGLSMFFVNSGAGWPLNLGTVITYFVIGERAMQTFHAKAGQQYT